MFSSNELLLWLSLFLPLSYSFQNCTQFSYDARDSDLYLFCSLFSLTNVFEITNFSTNYCDEPWIVDSNFIINIDCNNNPYINSLTHIVLNRNSKHLFHGELIPSQPWPTNLQQLSIHSAFTPDGVPAFYGAWDWSTITQLQYLYEINLHNDNFSGIMTNSDWNAIASMQSLVTFDIAGNHFRCDFSQIAINNVSAISALQLQHNLFYGTLGGFLSKFHDVTLFDITHNAFSGTIDWNTFAELDQLQTLVLSDNNFEGSINWQIISNLSNYSLSGVNLHNNLFSGFADFHGISSNLRVSLDENVLCDPARYLCHEKAHPINRSRAQCAGKTDCESTCWCSDSANTIRAKTIPKWNVSVIWSSLRLFFTLRIEHMIYVLSHYNYSDCQVEDILSEDSLNIIDSRTTCEFQFNSQSNEIWFDLPHPLGRGEIEYLSQHLSIKPNVFYFRDQEDSDGIRYKITNNLTVSYNVYPDAISTPATYAMWSSSFLYITVHVKMYDNDYELKWNDNNYSDCSIFADETLALIGDNDAICDINYVSDIITIELANTATIGLNDNIAIKGNIFSYTHTLSQDIRWISWTNNLTLAIEYPSSDNIELPHIIASIPDQIGACNNLILDARSTTNIGGRDAVFEWKLYDYNNLYIGTYIGAYAVVDYIELSSDEIVSPLAVYLNVTTWYQASRAAKYSVVLYDALIPLLQLHGIDEYLSTNNELYSDNIVIYSTIVFEENCDLFAYQRSDYVAAWTVSVVQPDEDVIVDVEQFQLLRLWTEAQENDMIVIEPSVYLQAGLIYTFEMRLSQNNGYGVSASHSITTLSSDIQCNILGGDIILTAPIDLDFFSSQPYILRLDGETLCYDPDKSSTTDHLAFSWRCFATFGYGENEETDCSELINDNATAITAVLFDEQLQLMSTMLYSYRFVLTVSDTNYHSRGDCVDEMVFEFHTASDFTDGPNENPFPLMISVIAIQNMVNINDKIRLMASIVNDYSDIGDDISIEYEWNENNGLLSKNELDNCQQSNELNLILKQNCLPLIAGEIYAFELSIFVYDDVSNVIASGVSSLTFISVLNAPQVEYNSFTLVPDICSNGHVAYSSSPYSLSIDIYSKYDSNPLLYWFYYEYNENIYYLHPLMQSHSYIDNIYLPIGNVTFFVNVYDSKLSSLTQSISCSIEFESADCIAVNIVDMIRNNTRFMNSEHDKYSFILQQSLIHLQYLQTNILMHSDVCLLASLGSILNVLHENINDRICFNGFEILLTQTLTLWLKIVSQSDEFIQYFYVENEQRFSRVYDLLTLSLDPCSFISHNLTYSNVKYLTIRTDSIVTNIVRIYYKSNQITSYLSAISTNTKYHHLLYSLSTELRVVLDELSGSNFNNDEYSYDIYNLLSCSLHISSLSSVSRSIPGESSLIELDSFSIYNSRIAHSDDENIDILVGDIDVMVADVNNMMIDGIFSSVDLLMTVSDLFASHIFNTTNAMQLSTKSVSISILSGGIYTKQLSSNINITFPWRSIRNETQCVWYNEAQNEWLTDGCFTYLNAEENILCSCSHLTTFATIDNIHSYYYDDDGDDDDDDDTNFTDEWLQSDLWNISNLFSCITFSCIFLITLKDIFPFCKLMVTKKKTIKIETHRSVFAVSLITISAAVYTLICVEAYLIKINFHNPSTSGIHLKIYTFLLLLPEATLFILFSIIFYSWFRLAHSRIKKRDSFRKCVRYMLYTLNLFIWCFLILYYLSIFIYRRESIFCIAAYIWSVILSASAIFITIYSILVNRVLFSAAKISQGQSFAVKDRKVVRRLLFVNTFLTFYFIFQAFSTTFFAHKPRHQSVIYHAAYSFIDAACLVLIFWMYRGSVQKLKPHQKNRDNVVKKPRLQNRASAFMTATKGTAASPRPSIPTTPASPSSPPNSGNKSVDFECAAAAGANTLNVPRIHKPRHLAFPSLTAAPSTSAAAAVAVTPPVVTPLPVAAAAAAASPSPQTSFDTEDTPEPQSIAIPQKQAANRTTTSSEGSKRRSDSLLENDDASIHSSIVLDDIDLAVIHDTK